MLRENSAKNNAKSSILSLWEEGFFVEVRTLKDVSKKISEKMGHNFSSVEISKALVGANFLIRSGKRGSFKYKQKINFKSKKIENIESQLFSIDLMSRFGSSFKTEIEDLHLNFGKSGTCTAFLLRKILEKSIYLAFAKNGLMAKIEDNSGAGRLVGLEAMIDACTREKINNIPFLIPKTAEKIRGVKFLGDTSAHNPLTNIDMETILPQMPFIITAYKELAERL